MPIYSPCVPVNEYIVWKPFFILTDSEVVSELWALQPGPQDFELRAVVGRGRFAEVQVVREKATGDVCALKVMNKTVLRTQENVSFPSFFWQTKYFNRTVKCRKKIMFLKSILFNFSTTRMLSLQALLPLNNTHDVQ